MGTLPHDASLEQNFRAAEYDSVNEHKQRDQQINEMTYSRGVAKCP